MNTSRIADDYGLPGGSPLFKGPRPQPTAQEPNACKAEPSPTTVENLLDQKIQRLIEEIHQIIVLKHRTPMTILHRPASDIREIAALL